MKLKKQKKEKEKIEKRYEDTQEQHFDMYLNLSKSLHSWKMAFFSLSILLAITLSGTLYLSTRSSLVPYVIEVDQTGNAKAINPAYRVKYVPKKMEQEYFLKELVKNMRNISRDKILTGRNYKKNTYFLKGIGFKKYRQLIEKEDLTKLVTEGITRDTKIVSINDLTKSTYQIRWVETVYDKTGEITKKLKMVGVFSIKTVNPTTLEEINNNPLGIIINDFSMSKEGY